MFERVAAGVPGTIIAEEFGQEYEPIDQSSVNEFLRLHPEEYKEWRDKNFKDDVRLADRKARLVSLQRVADKVRTKIEKMLTEKAGEILSAAELEKTPIGILLREYREYIEQIRDESGDKPKTGKEEGDRGGQVITIINTIPDVLADVSSTDRSKESSRAGSGFRMDRL